MTAQNSIEGSLKGLKDILREAEKYRCAAEILGTDIQTVCPQYAMEDEGEVAVFLENREYLLRRDQEYGDRLVFLQENRDKLSEWDKALIDSAYRRHLKESGITPERAARFSLLSKKAYASWRKAFEESDLELFREPLSRVIDSKKEMCALRILTPEEKKRFSCVYDLLLDDYERGFTVEKLDRVFNECRIGISGLLKKIRESDKKIRTDFLTRPVSVDMQMRAARWLNDLIGFDSKRGSLILAKHAFTARLTRNDVRITTYLDDNNFTTGLYTVLHEAGHALFEQLQPKENFEYFLTEEKTQGMHESVSRFYENIIGRSQGFIHFVYPHLKDLLPEVMHDVSERELYEAVNLVQPSLVRTEADEVTYSLHIIIRYELEKELINGDLTVDDLEEAWNSKYRDYLGISPGNVREGVMQDVHWTSEFGYFPTYLLGNIYGAMYYKTMCSELPVDTLLREGNIGKITDWMKERVFKKADRLSPEEWIKDITGKDITPGDYLEYLEQKVTEIYG